MDLQGRETEEFVDRLGHGTAAAAAIHEKAPEAELWAVKVFDGTLSTTVRSLVRAMDWASERGCRLVNLSLGTVHAFREPELAPSIERAVERGTIVVSAFEHEGVRWYPGSMKGAIGVLADAGHDRSRASIVDLDGKRVVCASPFPRPIPGVPPERNLNGISFAVANATGVLASCLAGHPDVRRAEDALDLLSAS